MRIASATGLDGRLQRRKRSPAASERLQSRPYGSPSEKTGRGAEGERAFVGGAHRRRNRRRCRREQRPARRECHWTWSVRVQISWRQPL